MKLLSVLGLGHVSFLVVKLIGRELVGGYPLGVVRLRGNLSLPQRAQGGFF